MKTLLINAHPDYSNPIHFSLKAEKLFLEQFQQTFPTIEPTILNLYEQTIPRIEDGQLQSIWQKQLTHQQLSEQEKKLATLSSNLLKQFKEHHRIVLISPLHNFNVPSRLKDYIDNLLIARETFAYIETPAKNGKASVGLMTANYKMLLLYASGSIYTEDNFYQALDFAPQYLKSIFKDIMGFDRFDIIRAEGTAFLPEKTVLKAVSLQLEQVFDSFYH